MVIDYSQTINRFTLLDAFPLPRIHEMQCKIAKYSIFSMLYLKSAYLQVAIKTEDKSNISFEAVG